MFHSIINLIHLITFYTRNTSKTQLPIISMTSFLCVTLSVIVGAQLTHVRTTNYQNNCPNAARLAISQGLANLGSIWVWIAPTEQEI
jgi:hypothetical protein